MLVQQVWGIGQESPVQRWPSSPNQRGPDPGGPTTFLSRVSQRQSAARPHGPRPSAAAHQPRSGSRPQPCGKGWVPTRGRRGRRKAARGRQGSPEASARALGPLRPRAPRPSEPGSERSQCAAGSHGGRTRGGGWRERRELGEQPSPDRAAGARGLGRGDRAGPHGTSPWSPAPQLGVAGTPSRPPRAGGVGPGGIFAPPSAEAAGGRGVSPSPPAAGTPRARSRRSPGSCSEPALFFPPRSAGRRPR